MKYSVMTMFLSGKVEEPKIGEKIIINYHAGICESIDWENEILVLDDAVELDSTNCMDYINDYRLVDDFTFYEDDDEEEEEPTFEDDYFDECGFNPYLGCYDYDC